MEGRVEREVEASGWRRDMIVYEVRSISDESFIMVEESNLPCYNVWP